MEIKNIAVEGMKDDIVPIICRILEQGNYSICFRNESPFGKADRSITERIIESDPDLTIVCNARGYLDFLDNYIKQTDIPVLVLTGGGPDFEEKAKKYTLHVLPVPFNPINRLYEKIREIETQQTNK